MRAGVCGSLVRPSRTKPYQTLPSSQLFILGGWLYNVNIKLLIAVSPFKGSRISWE